MSGSLRVAEETHSESPAFVVFTDLDGTLLELDTYSFERSVSALKHLKERGIPVVFCSSKTRVEQEYFRERLDVADPFITENGSAIYYTPESGIMLQHAEPLDEDLYVHVLGVRAGEIRERLAASCDDLQMSCRLYADLSLGEIMELTGLDEEAARRASNREFSETVLKAAVPVSHRLFDDLTEKLAQVGLRGVRGSKFYTVSGLGAHKGAAVELLSKAFKIRYPHVQTVGIGDGENDAPMLQMVDMPYLVQKPDGRWSHVPMDGVTRIEGIGPEGWSQVAAEILR